MDGALVRENIKALQEKRIAEETANKLRQTVKRKNDRINELQETLRIARQRSAYFEEKNARGYEAFLRRRRENRPVHILLWLTAGIVILTALTTLGILLSRGLI